jgi:hypothetical protein
MLGLKHPSASLTQGWHSRREDNILVPVCGGQGQVMEGSWTTVFGAGSFMLIM